jgi:hypothetical protein
MNRRYNSPVRKTTKLIILFSPRISILPPAAPHPALHHPLAFRNSDRVDHDLNLLLREIL